MRPQSSKAKRGGQLGFRMATGGDFDKLAKERLKVTGEPPQSWEILKANEGFVVILVNDTTNDKRLRLRLRSRASSSSADARRLTKQT